MFSPSLMQALTPEIAEEFIARRLQDDFVFSKEDWNLTTEARTTLGVPGLNRFLQIVAADPKFIISTPVLRQIRKFREAGIADFDPDKNLEKIEARAAVATDLAKRMMPAIADNDFSAQDWKDLKPIREELISKLEQGGLAAFNMLFWALRADGGWVDKKVRDQLQKFVDAGYMNASVVAGLAVYDSAPPAAPAPAPAAETEAERIARLARLYGESPDTGGPTIKPIGAASETITELTADEVIQLKRVLVPLIRDAYETFLREDSSRTSSSGQFTLILEIDNRGFALSVAVDKSRRVSATDDPTPRLLMVHQEGIARLLSRETFDPATFFKLRNLPHRDQTIKVRIDLNI